MAKFARLQEGSFVDQPWRIFRIMSEFVEGFQELAEIRPAVCVFGGSLVRRNSREYNLARRVGAQFARRGITVMTGGGPGIMEAASRGAFEIGGVTVGLNIDLPEEQKPNAYLTRVMNFRYFFSRKYMFLYHSMAYVIFPGGFGTLDELYESLTLIQTERNPRFPVVLVGSDYWTGHLDWLKRQVVRRGYISRRDLDNVTLLDDPVQIVNAALAYSKEAPENGSKKAARGRI